MTVAPARSLARLIDPPRWLRAALSITAPLTIAGAAAGLSLAGIAVGLLFDPRAITGAPAWIKPAKFAASISLYCLTLVWLLGFVRGHRRLVSAAAALTAVTLLLELGIIVLQVLRGTTSHYNVSTRFDTALWTAMAWAILVTWAAGLLVAVLLVRQRLPDRAFAWSLRLGISVTLIGMRLGLFMTFQRSPEQLARRAAGQPALAEGAHSVGVPDGGPGLPFVGWSTEGGDLRIGHFVGIHALQVVPLVGVFVSRRRAPWPGAGHCALLVITAAAAYLGLALLLTWQALRGQSLVAPDALTLSALVGLVAATALAAGGVLLHARLRASPAVPRMTAAGGVS